MERLLFDEFAREFKRGSDLSFGDAVLALNFFEGHAAGKASHDDGDWHARTCNHGLAMTNIGVDFNCIRHAGLVNNLGVNLRRLGKVYARIGL